MLAYAMSKNAVKPKGEKMGIRVNGNLECIGGCIQENVPVDAIGLCLWLLWILSIEKGA